MQLRAHSVAPSLRRASRSLGQLDGLPLAIELAAARVPLLGIDGLHARLGERLRLLTAGHRLALRRHQTLRAALEWSHGLLKFKPPESDSLEKPIAVFRRRVTAPIPRRTDPALHRC
jgi:hypothetical protein